MATDRAVDLGVRLAELAPETVDALNEVLPASWSHGNPVDIIGDARRERYHAMPWKPAWRRRRGRRVGHADAPGDDPPTEAADAVIEVAKNSQKAGDYLLDGRGPGGRKAASCSRMPAFPTSPPRNRRWRCSPILSAFYENQRQLMQTPGPCPSSAEPDVEGARLIIESALAEGRHLLTEVESKALLSAFRIPWPRR
jgi:acetyltransferase